MAKRKPTENQRLAFGPRPYKRTAPPSSALDRDEPLTNGATRERDAASFDRIREMRPLRPPGRA